MNHLSLLDFIKGDNLKLVTSNFEEAHSIVTNLKWSPSTKPKNNMNINHIDLPMWDMRQFSIRTGDGDVILKAPDTCGFMACIVHVPTHSLP